MKKKVPHHKNPKIHAAVLVGSTVATAGKEALESEAIHNIIILFIGHSLVFISIGLPIAIAIVAYSFSLMKKEI